MKHKKCFEDFGVKNNNQIVKEHAWERSPAHQRSFGFALVDDDQGRSALEVGGASRDRTGDLLLAKQALSQLSYGP